MTKNCKACENCYYDIDKNVYVCGYEQNSNSLYFNVAGVISNPRIKAIFCPYYTTEENNEE